MRSLKVLATAGVVAFVLAFSPVMALAAANYKTPTAALAGVLERDVEEILDERLELGRSYGDIAEEAGLLDEYKAELTEIRREALERRVAAGIITQEQADAAMVLFEEHIADCYGLDYGNGCGLGAGLGCGLGGGYRIGYGNGNGMGRGTGCCGGRY